MKNLVIIMTAFILLLMPAKTKSLGLVKSDIGITDEIQQITIEQLNSLGIEKWDEYIRTRENSKDNIYADMSIKDMIMDIIKGKFQLDWGTMFQKIGKIFFSEVTLGLYLGAKLIVISVITGIISNFKTSFSDSSIGELAWIVCYIMMVILIIQSIVIAIDIGKNTIDQMTSFMQILFPILLALLIGMGGIASSGILQPATVLLSGVTGVLLKNIMIPLILLSSVIILVSNINDNIRLESLGKLTKSVCGWILGIIFTVFIGVLSIQGILAASFDGLSIRTTKYTIEAFVPVVGKMFSQTVDILIGCSLMLKNAIGLVGLIVAVGICLYPILKIIALIAIYKLCGALLEPISDKRIVACLNEIGSVLVILFATIVGITIMFFMTIALLVGVGNITIMMR